MLNMAPGKMAQAASEIPEGRTFSGIDFSGVTVASSWEDKYDQAFYSKIESEYENGYTTADTALEIGTAAELAAFAKFVNDGVSSGSPDYKNSHGFENKFVCLTDDIDLQGVAPTVDYQNDGDDRFEVVLTGEVSNNWVPIGNFNDSLAFNGTFDGGLHSIKGLISFVEYYSGFFGCISSNACIKNLIVCNSYFFNTAGGPDGDTKVGAIVAYINGELSVEIINCYSQGNFISNLSCSSYAGGIVGCDDTYTNPLLKISNSGTVGNYFLNQGECGGILYKDYNNGLTIKNCFSAENKGAEWIGRLKNVIFIHNNPSLELSNCYYDTNTNECGDDYATGLTIDKMQGEAAKTNMVGFADATYNGKPVWLFEEGQYPKLNPAICQKKKPKSSDFTFTLPEDLDYDGQGKTITIAPKPGITGMGAVTVKYYKVENGSTTLLDGPPTDAGRYKVKFDVASGTEYYSATDLPAMF